VTPWQIANHDRYLAKKREYRLAHRDQLNAAKRQWHAENKVEQNKKSLEYFYDHHDELVAKNSEYKKANRPAVSKQQREHRTDQRLEGGKIQLMRAWLDGLKAGPCLDCGGTFPPCAMDWDHVRGEKKFNLGSRRGFLGSREILLAEIEKCDLVCANCHRVRTNRRRLDAGSVKGLQNQGDVS
jgi:hypothetical protein